jgi:TRAP-type C4-dicarboxylate transport system permease large subunit
LIRPERPIFRPSPSAIGRVPPDAAMGRIWPYLGALMVALAIVALIPWISVGFL